MCVSGPIEITVSSSLKTLFSAQIQLRNSRGTFKNATDWNIQQFCEKQTQTYITSGFFWPFKVVYVYRKQGQISFENVAFLLNP